MSFLNSTSNESSRLSRQVLVAAGGLGLAGVGLAAGLMLRAPAAPPAVEPAPTTVAAPAASAHNHSAQADSRRTAVASASGDPVAPAAPAAAAMQNRPLRTVSLCGDCGVIEHVRVIRRQGEGTGLGAVVGGVLGGVVGHQMGGGSGKTALTLLGAVGGGLAGNEVEKRQRAETVYEMVVRMDDGSERRFTQSSPVIPGTRVTVDRRGIHVAEEARAHPTNLLRTSATGAS
jgi:outer membrane lipoprotein SlyB